jgi:hypothetical protein
VPVLDIQPLQSESSCMCRFDAGIDRGVSFGGPANGRLLCEIGEVCLNCLLSSARGSARDYINIVIIVAWKYSRGP